MKGWVMVSSGIALENFEKAKAGILAQLDDGRKGVISEEELRWAMGFVKNNFKVTEDGQGRLEEFWLGQAVAGQQDTPSDMVAAVETVTGEDVAQLAQSLCLDSVYFLKGRG